MAFSYPHLPERLDPRTPATALAPMQDVTTLPFMRLIARYGPPDYFFTEYFRVHAHSRLERHILESITGNDTGRPVFAQLIGEDLHHLQRTVEALRPHAVAGIDLNLGCPAPKVYKKNVGGGLLRDPGKVDSILGLLRAAIPPPGRLTVKMRLGFDSTAHFGDLLDLMKRHQVDLVSIHGRTVSGGYRSEVDYARIAAAVERLPMPVFANGDIGSPEKAAAIHRQTGCWGLMVGRGAIRNPWIFRQIRERMAGRPLHRPTLGDVRDYIERLWTSTARPGMEEGRRVAAAKKFLNFIGTAVDANGTFLREIRRAPDAATFFGVCNRHLTPRASEPYPLEPFEGLTARPNRESPPGEPAQSHQTGGETQFGTRETPPMSLPGRREPLVARISHEGGL